MNTGRKYEIQTDQLVNGDRFFTVRAADIKEAILAAELYLIGADADQAEIVAVALD